MKHSFLRLEDLCKTYSSGFTLKVNRLRLEAGERVGLVGNNGAGKTTLLLLMLNLLRADGGRVRMNGLDVRQDDTWRCRTASYLGESSLIGFLTPHEYWSFVASVYEIRESDRRRSLTRYEAFLELSSGRKLIREFSMGNRKKIGLVAAMMVRPMLLLLDEPFAGLDPRSQSVLRLFLDELNRDSGTTLLVSSHDLAHVVDLCGRIVVLENGRIAQDAPVCAGSLRDIEGYLTGVDLERAVR